MSEQIEKEKIKTILEKLRTVVSENEDVILMEFKKHYNNVYGAIIKKFYHQMLKFEYNIRNLLSQGDLYSAKILHRSLIEHAVTLQYIWCREHILKDENLTSEKFFIIYRIAENIKRFGFDNKVNRILNEHLEKDTVKLYSKIRGQDEKITRNALEHSSQFKLEKMVDFLVKDESLKNVLKGFNSLFLGAIGDYNVLSSYVHGGPSALFWDAETNIYDEEQISSDLDILIGTMLKIVIWTYTQSSGDTRIENLLNKNMSSK